MNAADRAYTVMRSDVKRCDDAMREKYCDVVERAWCDVRRQSLRIFLLCPDVLPCLVFLRKGWSCRFFSSRVGRSQFLHSFTPNPN